MTWPDPILQALARPSGARFYRCALHVNPFDYFARHDRAPRATDELTYNRAFVGACVAERIEVIELRIIGRHRRTAIAVHAGSAAEGAG